MRPLQRELLWHVTRETMGIMPIKLGVMLARKEIKKREAWSV